MTGAHPGGPSPITWTHIAHWLPLCWVAQFVQGLRNPLSLAHFPAPLILQLSSLTLSAPTTTVLDPTSKIHPSSTHIPSLNYVLASHTLLAGTWIGSGGWAETGPPGLQGLPCRVRAPLSLPLRSPADGNAAHQPWLCGDCSKRESCAKTCSISPFPRSGPHRPLLLLLLQTPLTHDHCGGISAYGRR